MDPAEDYARLLKADNYVCQVLLGGQTRAVLFIDRRFSTADQARGEFRQRAKEIKAQEGVDSLKLVMYL